MEKEKNQKYENKEWEVSTAKLLKAHGYADGSENAAKATAQAKLAEELAKEILKLSQHTLLINLRFMETAFIKMIPDHDMDTLTMATDGKYLYYNSVHICQQFRRAKEIPVRDYLHVILHCVFRHIFISKKMNIKIWDLACDIAVENIINKLKLKSLDCERQISQMWLIKDLEEQLPRLSAEWIYKHFVEENISDEEVEQLRKNFFADDHSIWHNKTILDQGNGDKDENDVGEHEEDIGKKIDPEDAVSDSSIPEGEEGEHANASDELLAVIESEDGGGKGGEGEGENVEINDDEFDYIFYTYGLKLYDRMPLVEPLEYKEVKKIREFVIAIDTSESVSGDIVQKFVTKTWNILKQSENFFRKINIHIIQCGARVEEDVRICSQEEFDEYINNMVLKGFGGTDFRPVFTRVDELIRQHEFVNLKGLIYFTDGYGTFPNKAPQYDTAFLFLDQGYDLPEVPPWAIKMLMTEDEIREF